MGDGHPLYLAAGGRRQRGVKGTVVVPAPAVGSEWLVTVPGGQQWRVLSVFCTLTTSAQVASRQNSLQLTDGTNIFFRGGNTASSVASSITPCCWAVGTAQLSIANADEPNSFPMPNLWLPAGYTIGTFTHTIQTGDQFSKAILYVEQYYITDTELTEHAQERDEYRRELYEQEAGQTGNLQTSYR